MDGQARYSIRFHPAHPAAIGTLAAIALALIAPGCGREVETPRFRPEDVQVELGVAGVHDRSRWNLLRITALNSGADFRGSLEVGGIVWDRSGEKRRDPVSYRIDVEFSPGTAREIAIPVRPEDWVEVVLEFRQPGWSRGLRLPMPPSDASEFRILVATEDRCDLTALERWIEENYLPPSALREAPSNPRARRCRAVFLRPEDLPRRPAAFAPFQLLLLHGTTLAAAPPGAVEALAEWVEAGGTLIAAPGPAWTGGLLGPVAELLAVRVEDSAPGRAAGISRELLIHGDRDGLHHRFAPAAGARLSHRGLAIESRRGAGSVLTLRFAPLAKRASTGGQAAFPEPGEAPELYAILHAPLSRSASFGGGSGGALRELERGLSSVLFAMAGFHVPSRGAVALGLAVYILAGFLAPALVFRRLRRREWTFAVVIAAAAIATFGIYRFGLLSSMDALELEEVTVLRLHADGGSAEATSFLGAISPQLQRLRLEADAESPRGEAISNAFTLPLRGRFPSYSYRYREENLPVPQTEIEVDPAGALRLPEVTLHPNGMRFFRSDYRAGIDGFLEIESAAASAPGHARFRLRNPHAAPLYIYLARREIYTHLRTIGPGSEEVVECRAGPVRGGRSASELNPAAGMMEGVFFTNRGHGHENPDVWWPPEPHQRSALMGALKAVAAPWRQSFEDYPWQVQQPTAGAPKFLGDERLPPPGFLIAAVAEPFFPAASGFERRKAMTVLVIELPAEAVP